MKVFVIVGQSGSGKSTALHVFEDLRMTTADGVPPDILPDVVGALAGGSLRQDVAVGIAQNRVGFADALAKGTNALKATGAAPTILYLQADRAELIRRYATTRRPHPMEHAGLGLDQAVTEEADMLGPVRRMADVVIDTTAFSIHDLRRELQRLLTMPDAPVRAMKVHLISFGFKYGTPAEADLVFDVRFLPNPYFDPVLRPLDGRDPRVADRVFSTEAARRFLSGFVRFVRETLPFYADEGRYRLSVAVGCTGGRHRSVAVTEALAAALREDRFPVAVEHKHMGLG